jgi:hypothetical protein
MNAKKILIYIILFIFISPLLFTYDFFKKNKVIGFGYVSNIIVHEGKAYYYDGLDGYAEIKKADMKVDEYGFFHILISNMDAIIIPGDSRCEIFRCSYYDSKEFREIYEKYYPYTLEDIEWPGRMNINEIKASSYLSEETDQGSLEYKPENLKIRYLIEHMRDFFNEFCLPWVEGVEGDGTGETLEVTFIEPTNVFVILNGFVDILKRNLYKDNNRLKTINIKSLDNSFDFNYTFEDVVMFSDIDLPEYTKGIRIEILEVYPGDKYNDTCISGIIGKRMKTTYDNALIKQKLDEMFSQGRKL